MGEECPDCRPGGANKAVAGDWLDLWLPSSLVVLPLVVVPPLADAGRGVVETASDEAEEIPGSGLPFCWRWASGNSGSGGFLALRSLKKGVDFLGVVLGLSCEGLWWERRSPELASDLEDSEGRFAGGVRTVPFGLLVDGRGDSGSSRVAREGRLLSSANDLRRVFFPRGRFIVSSSRGWSIDRRNMPIREGFFLGPLKSLVGAVVIISGAWLVLAEWCILSTAQRSNYVGVLEEVSRPAALPEGIAGSRKHCGT